MPVSVSVTVSVSMSMYAPVSVFVIAFLVLTWLLGIVIQNIDILCIPTL